MIDRREIAPSVSCGEHDFSNFRHDEAAAVFFSSAGVSAEEDYIHQT
jgi:hypothetical protein